MSLRAASARLLHVGARARELGGAGDASVLRPKVVSDFQSQRVSQERFKWRLFGIGTWVRFRAREALDSLLRWRGREPDAHTSSSHLLLTPSASAPSAAGAHL